MDIGGEIGGDEGNGDADVEEGLSDGDGNDVGSDSIWRSLGDDDVGEGVRGLGGEGSDDDGIAGGGIGEELENEMTWDGTKRTEHATNSDTPNQNGDRNNDGAEISNVGWELRGNKATGTIKAAGSDTQSEDIYQGGNY